MRDLLVYLAFRVASAAFGALPEAAARRTGEAVGWAAFFIAGPRRLMAIRHMTRVLGAEGDPTSAAHELFARYGRYWAEIFWFKPRRVPSILRHVSYEGLEHARAARDAGHGAVFVVPHLGNWEMAGPLGVRERIRIVAVAEALANHRIAEWFTRLRAALGIEVVLADGRRRSYRALLDAIEENAGVALLCDRDLTGRGVPVEFFGEKTTLPPGPATLALRTGAPIIPVAVYFRRGRGHHVVVRPPIVLPPRPEGTDRDARDRWVAEVTAMIAEALEALIRRAPTQWHLVQPNWPSDREALERWHRARRGAERSAAGG